MISTVTTIDTAQQQVFLAQTRVAVKEQLDPLLALARHPLVAGLSPEATAYMDSLIAVIDKLSYAMTALDRFCEPSTAQEEAESYAT
jgi:hypothetical protein